MVAVRDHERVQSRAPASDHGCRGLVYKFVGWIYIPPAAKLGFGRTGRKERSAAILQAEGPAEGTQPAHPPSR